MPHKDAEARRLYQQQYRKKNREVLLEKQHQYYQDNREQLLAQKHEYDTAHAELRRACERLKRQTHGEEIRAKQRAHYAENKEWYIQNNKKPSTKATVRRYYLKHLEERRANCRLYHLQNRDKISSRKRQYRIENHARILENFRKYQKANPEIFINNKQKRRARQMAVVCTLTAAQWREIKEAYRHRCAYCGRKIKWLTQDHITPLARGGTHTLSNVVPACRPCNSRKYINPPPVPVQPLLLTLA